MPQIGALVAFGVGALVIGLVLAWIGRSAGAGPDDADVIIARTARLRQVGFGALLALAVLALALSLPRAPYGFGSDGRFAADGDAMVVPILAYQYGWRGFPEEVPLGRPVRFDLISADVNHGFAIYDRDDRIIGQIQAMPGYINKLTVRFDEPGRYTIRCLELCGLYHHAMILGFCAGPCPE